MYDPIHTILSAQATIVAQADHEPTIGAKEIAQRNLNKHLTPISEEVVVCQRYKVDPDEYVRETKAACPELHPTWEAEFRQTYSEIAS
jgi:hypothetical protein